MFEGEWEQRSLFGWETSIAKMNGESLNVADEAAKANAVELYC